MTSHHIPVLTPQILSHLSTVLKSPNSILIDCTFGFGGHSLSFLQSTNCKIIALDRDPLAIQRAHQLAKLYPNRLYPIHASFSELASPGFIKRHDIAPQSVNAILLDLGVSSMQLDIPMRGFSYRHSGPLDMRMDPSSTSSLTAATILNYFSESQIADILEQGEESLGKKIARSIVNYRSTVKLLETTSELAELVCAATGKRPFQKHPATKTFQALRIYINQELQELSTVLDASLDLLKPKQGLLAAISFHSLEDKIIKRFIKKYESGKTGSWNRKDARKIRDEHVSLEDSLQQYQYEFTPILQRINKKVIKPDLDEIEQNPRSRSAKLRIACRV